MNNALTALILWRWTLFLIDSNVACYPYDSFFAISLTLDFTDRNWDHIAVIMQPLENRFELIVKYLNLVDILGIPSLTLTRSCRSFISALPSLTTHPHSKSFEYDGEQWRKRHERREYKFSCRILKTRGLIGFCLDNHFYQHLLYIENKMKKSNLFSFVFFLFHLQERYHIQVSGLRVDEKFASLKHLR